MKTLRQRNKSIDKENKKRHARREAKKLARPEKDGFRKLTLASGVWKWDAGKENVIIVSPTGERTLVHFCAMLGVSMHVLENLLENKGAWVMPGHVREYIEKNLIGEQR